MGTSTDRMLCSAAAVPHMHAMQPPQALQPLARCMHCSWGTGRMLRRGAAAREMRALQLRYPVSQGLAAYEAEQCLRIADYRILTYTTHRGQLGVKATHACCCHASCHHGPVSSAGQWCRYSHMANYQPGRSEYEHVRKLTCSGH